MKTIKLIIIDITIDIIDFLSTKLSSLKIIDFFICKKYINNVINNVEKK